MLSLSYFKIWASFESSRGAARATATRPARTINCRNIRRNNVRDVRGFCTIFHTSYQFHLDLGIIWIFFTLWTNSWCRLRDILKTKRRNLCFARFIFVWGAEKASQSIIIDEAFVWTRKSYKNVKIREGKKVFFYFTSSSSYGSLGPRVVVSWNCVVGARGTTAQVI